MSGDEPWNSDSNGWKWISCLQRTKKTHERVWDSGVTGKSCEKSARKLTRSRAVRSKLGGLKIKIGAKLKRKIGTQLKGKIGAQMKKKVNAAVTRRVHQIKPAPLTVKHNIRNELSKEIRKLTPKRSIKGGPSHNELVRRAERMIYSGANF